MTCLTSRSVRGEPRAVTRRPKSSAMISGRTLIKECSENLGARSPEHIAHQVMITVSARTSSSPRMVCSEHWASAVRWFSFQNFQTRICGILPGSVSAFLAPRRSSSSFMLIQTRLGGSSRKAPRSIPAVSNVSPDDFAGLAPDRQGVVL
jgi:hypothetical protein